MTFYILTIRNMHDCHMQTKTCLNLFHNCVTQIFYCTIFLFLTHSVDIALLTYNIEFRWFARGHASKVLTCLSFRNVVVWRFHIFSHSMQCAAAIFCLNKCYIHNSCKHSTISLTLHEKKFLIEFKKICMNWAIN